MWPTETSIQFKSPFYRSKLFATLLCRLLGYTDNTYMKFDSILIDDLTILVVLEKARLLVGKIRWLYVWGAGRFLTSSELD